MIRLAFLLFCLAGAAHGLELSVPNATPVKIESQSAASLRLPDAPWSPETQAPVVDGEIRRTVLRTPSNTLTTLQLLAPLSEILTSQGYVKVFTCADAICGGFDFRFKLDLIGEPHMHVDLGNYRYALFSQPGGNPHTVALVASSSNTQGFIHITEVSDVAFPAPAPIPEEPEPTPEVTPTSTAAGDLATHLDTLGRAVLDDLEFGTGSADLGNGPYLSLIDLSDWLGANPTARVVLVGHTDAVGSLEANTNLSRRRAAAVADRLINAFEVDSGQLQAAGAGYLAPRATNLTPEGLSLIHI